MKVVLILLFLFLIVDIQCSGRFIDSPIAEIVSSIPKDDKGFLFYFIVGLFVVSALFATISNGIFIVLTVIFWQKFKGLPFFWLLAQLNIIVFVLAILNLFLNVPATLFPEQLTDIVDEDVFLAASYVIEFCQYCILVSIFIISWQRFTIFVIPKLGESIFRSPFILIWILSIWVLSGIVVFIISYNKCQYMYIESQQKYSMFCESTKAFINTANPKIVGVIELIIQILLPLLNLIFYICIITKIILMKRAKLNKQEIGILKQALAIFVLFQISSLLFIYCQTFRFKSATAFLLKRMVNTTQLFAGSATPCFFFFSNPEMRKLFCRNSSEKNSRNKMFQKSISNSHPRSIEPS